MRVRSIRVGYFDHKRIRAGEEFNIPDALFSKKWMENIDAKPDSFAPVKSAEAKVVKSLPSREVI